MRIPQSFGSARIDRGPGRGIGQRDCCRELWEEGLIGARGGHIFLQASFSAVWLMLAVHLTVALKLLLEDTKDARWLAVLIGADKPLGDRCFRQAGQEAREKSERLAGTRMYRTLRQGITQALPHPITMQ